MTVMLEKLYDALRAGDVPDDKARAAAVEAAEHTDRMAKIEGDLLILKWMAGFNSAMTAAVLLKLFT